MVDDFLQRASMLDKAANDCRGQAAELLQVLQQRVRSSNVSYSNSNSKSRSNSGVSSASPYMSSLDASNSHSAHSGRSGRSMNSITDDVSDISQATGLASLKTNSSLGSLTSLKSFEDEPIKTKIMSVKHLSTVSECLFESRATSFAASRQTSLNSHGSKTGSIFNENLRLALMGEIANKNIKLLVAHAGDCRVVLCDGGQAVQMTLDHTPLLDVEKFRIKSSGGFVSNKRVNGILAVSRSFGDIKFKSFNKELKIPDSAIDESRLPEGIWSNSNQVISMPEVVELEVLSTYEFVVIASDCVWETLTCKEVISFVRMQLLEHGDSMKAAEALASKVTDDGGTDNCSIIIVNLNQT
jgi:serine/threonine protein phosphatase PrpC